jgi:arylsulfatase A-like enzyme/glycosyltransferase involved in cell wall biosynthesis
MDALTVLICTHNRAELLERVLASLNAARRPAMPVHILVVANACSDETVVRMHAYLAQQAERHWLPLQVIEEPTPGKSHALNTAISQLGTELTAFVDDDHRVDANYLKAIERAAQAFPDAGLYCGRILPDWDGTEPDWVHDDGPYKIYPLPVPRYDQGARSRVITAEEGPIPGGGNLIVRKRVFEQTGLFSTELGPQGHDLGGGEDSEYVLRALHRGETCRYTPEIAQYHYVDSERLNLGYLLKKSYQRTRSTSRLVGDGSVPLYMWRKVTEYGVRCVFSPRWVRRRFYLVRLAAALGEVRGRREAGHRRRQVALPADGIQYRVAAIALVTLASALTAVLTFDGSWTFLLAVLVPAGLGALGILFKSLLDFSQTGPQMRGEVMRHYRGYTLFALARLTAWAYAILAFTGSAGMLLGYLYVTARGQEWGWSQAVSSTLLGMAVGVALQFLRKLRSNPGLLMASMHYRASRLYKLWEWVTPPLLRGIESVLLAGTVFLVVAATQRLFSDGRTGELLPLVAAIVFIAGVIVFAGWQPEARATSRNCTRRDRPNIVMVGSDTLRADRLSTMGYRRPLTPNIDALAENGALFTNCYVPCARTAPSLISLLTGTWPHTHGIRDNFISLDQTRLKVDALPTLLKPLGYRSAVMSDWCGADMGKFSFGFDYTDLPEDQWNLKYLIRQGPKDLRLFVSLFTHNRLGRWLLPELYYLGGVPLTRQIGRRARHILSRLADQDNPFLLNVFYSTTHPPFASEWPWYTRFADPGYSGESKFAMARLTDPFEIIRRQGAPRAEFDLDQIIDLYDGCVAHFDDEVGKMLAHIEASGLAENTIVVVYSDHGMEFFEHDTWGQGNSAVGEASPKIPLVIRDPRLPGRGKVNDVVRTIDLAPTLLELVGAPPPTRMEGISLAPCLSPGASCPPLDAFNETGIWIADIPGLPENHLRYPDLLELIEVQEHEYGTLGIKPEYDAKILFAKDRMIRRGRWKLVYQPLYGGVALKLFNVEADPGCRCDLSAEEPLIVRDLYAALTRWLTEDNIPVGRLLAAAKAELAGVAG